MRLLLKLRSILVTVFFMSLAASANITAEHGEAAVLPAGTLAQAERWLALEQVAQVLPGHESTLTLVRDPLGRPVRAKYAVLVVSGLYNSPSDMEPSAAHFAAKQLNVLNMRLAGHWEQDPAALKRTVGGRQWKAQTDEALDLARQLGEKVILVGHSTGALLLTWAAVKRPDAVAGLALFSPAFRVSAVSALAAGISDFFRINIRSPSGRLATGHAGLEVQKMAFEFHSELSRLAGASGLRDRKEIPAAFVYAADRLKSVPIWLGNTDLDWVIDVEEANRFFHALGSSSQDAESVGAARTSHRLGACEFVLHDSIISPRGNPRFRTWLSSIDATFFGLTTRSEAR